MYANAENVKYFDSFGVGHIPNKIKKLIGNKRIIQIFIEYKHTIRQCADIYFCIEFIDFILKGNNLLYYKNLFSPNDYEKNDKIILKYFQ